MATNKLVTPLLTDLYQITMIYAHWKNNRHMEEAVFELFFRKNPFHGGYTIFAGLDECLKYLSNFKFTKSDLDYLQNDVPALSHCDPRFFNDYLANLDCSSLQIYALNEGTIAFPNLPLITVVGPLGIAQIIETTLLNLVNFPSLVATNACRMVLASKSIANTYLTKQKDKKKQDIILAEFGLRRSQGPDGGFTASKYSFLGGFDATSNVQAGKILGIPITGTNAHAYVQSHRSLDEVKDITLISKDGKQEINLLSHVLNYRKKLQQDDSLWLSTNDGELAAFISYAASFPNSFACIVDTYDTIKSGVRNFILTSLVLDDLGFIPRSIRLDSGDLSSLSIQASTLFYEIATKYNRPFLKNIDIVASNDLNETKLHELNQKGHAITIYGIGTNLVTCQEQPALGCVYKLVQLNGIARLKVSNEIEKVLIPGWKCPYRLYGEDGTPLIDLLIGESEKQNIPEVGEKILCRHPFNPQKRIFVIPSKVESLHHLVFDKKRGVIYQTNNLFEARKFVTHQMKVMNSAILRHINPKKYEVFVSEETFTKLFNMWHLHAPIDVLR